MFFETICSNSLAITSQSQMYVFKLTQKTTSSHLKNVYVNKRC